MGIATLVKSAEINAPGLHVLTDEELRDLQLLLVCMMKDIAAICRENDITWSLGGGSLLGAVRHKGFIPWDDDMDLTMPRLDFEKFKTVFPGKYSEKYELKLPGDKGFLYHFPKIYRKNTIAQNIQSVPGEVERISIDIFIMENVSDNAVLRTMHGGLCNILLGIDSAIRMKLCKDNLLKYGANSPQLCSAVKKRAVLASFFSFLKLEQWLKISDKVFSLCKNKNTEYIVIPSGNGHFFGELFLRKEMLTLKLAEFENQQFFIPENPECYLKVRYGNNYIEIPPKNNIEQHVFVQFNLA